jgi:hypothetical protein
MGTDRTERIPTVEPSQAQSSGSSPGVSLHPALQALHSWYVGSLSRGGTLSLHPCRTRDGFDLLQLYRTSVEVQAINPRTGLWNVSETSVLAAGHPSHFAGPSGPLVSWRSMQVCEIHMSAIRGLSRRSSFRSICSLK